MLLLPHVAPRPTLEAHVPDGGATRELVRNISHGPAPLRNRRLSWMVRFVFFLTPFWIRHVQPEILKPPSWRAHPPCSRTFHCTCSGECGSVALPWKQKKRFFCFCLFFCRGPAVVVSAAIHVQGQVAKPGVGVPGFTLATAFRIGAEPSVVNPDAFVAVGAAHCEEKRHFRHG